MKIPLCAGVVAYHRDRLVHSYTDIATHKVPVTVTTLDDASRLARRVPTNCRRFVNIIGATVALNKKPFGIMQAQGGISSWLLP